MSEFRGTKKEFIKFVGGYCRNKVRDIAAKERKKQNGFCECCGQKAELQSAHHRLLDRQTIVFNILDKFPKEGDIYIVELEKFEEMFIEAHMPIEDHFFFLCQNCHKKYDDGEINEDFIRTNNNCVKVRCNDI